MGNSYPKGSPLLACFKSSSHNSPFNLNHFLEADYTNLDSPLSQIPIVSSIALGSLISNFLLSYCIYFSSNFTCTALRFNMGHIFYLCI